MYTKIRHEDSNISLYVRDESIRGQQDFTAFRDVFESDIYDIRKSKLDVNTVKTIVDCGGHIGSFGILTSKCFPLAKIIAVEPNCDSANLYSLNMDLNKVRAKVLNVGLSYDKNKNTMIMGNDFTAISMLVSEEDAKKAVKEDYEGTWDLIKCFGKDCGLNRTYTIENKQVKTLTYEEFLTQENLTNIDIVKFDCEGAECDIFLNCKRESLERARVILCEFHWAKGGLDLYPRIKDKFINFTITHTNLNPVDWNQRVGYFMAIRKDVKI